MLSNRLSACYASTHLYTIQTYHISTYPKTSLTASITYTRHLETLWDDGQLFALFTSALNALAPVQHWIIACSYVYFVVTLLHFLHYRGWCLLRLSRSDCYINCIWIGTRNCVANWSLVNCGRKLAREQFTKVCTAMNSFQLFGYHQSCSYAVLYSISAVAQE